MQSRFLIAAVVLAWSIQPDYAVPKNPYQIVTLCTPYPATSGRRVSVSNGREFQQALDNAIGGDVIALAAGASFRPVAPEGSFVLRNRAIPTNQWVVIRSASAAFDVEGAIPPNRRWAEANAAEMPQVRATANNLPAIVAESGARGYRLVGLDIGAEPSIDQLANLVELRSGASDIVIDRCHIHGNDSGDFRRGVLLSGSRLAVIESVVENFHDRNSDSQAVGGSLGPGPFKIVNNVLEAASENIMFGGADPTVPNLVPTDIEIRRNLSTKRPAWRSAGIAAKNAFELKNARRVLVEGNIFENVWTSGQDGTAILLKSVNQDGACPWCVTEYVTFRNNVVRHAAHGLLINAAETGRSGVPQPVHANHIVIDNVLFDDIGTPEWAGGKLFRVFGGVADVTVTHVTSRSNPTGILDAGDANDTNPRLVFKFNIVERKFYGIGAGGDEGERTLTRNFPAFSYDQNVIVNTSTGTDQAIDDAALERRYPPKTSVAGGWAAVGLDPATMRLTATSRFRKAAADGKDVGIDVDAINAAQAGPGGSAACATTGRSGAIPFFARGE
jgi:hypothetical protein